MTERRNPIQLDAIKELLHLSNIQVESVLEQTENTIHLYVDMIEPVAPVCSACGAVSLPVLPNRFIALPPLPQTRKPDGT